MREFDSQQKMAGHIPHCKLNPNYEKNLKHIRHKHNNDIEGIFIHKDEMCFCQYCGKQYKLYGLKNHENYCNFNPNKKEHSQKYKNKDNNCWNKGLTKLNDDRIKKQGETYKENLKTGKIIHGRKGKHWSDEDKKRISIEKTKYYNEHPDLLPYRLYHSSKISYPEQYFINVFEKEKIDLKYHLRIGRFELDFYNEEKKIYIEIDGNTHKQKRVQEIDRRKDEYLKSLGWKGMRIDWDDYQNKSFEDKKLIVCKIKDFLI